MEAKFPNFQEANHAKLEEIGGGAKNHELIKIGLMQLSDEFADAVGGVVGLTAYGQADDPDSCAKALLAADAVLEEFTRYTRALFVTEIAIRLAKLNGEIVD